MVLRSRMKPFCSFFLSVLPRTNSGVAGEICCDKEVGNFAQSFDGRFDIGEVVVLAIKLSKEDETSRRRTMETMPHPTVTNCNLD